MVGSRSKTSKLVAVVLKIVVFTRYAAGATGTKIVTLESSSGGGMAVSISEWGCIMKRQTLTRHSSALCVVVALVWAAGAPAQELSTPQRQALWLHGQQELRTHFEQPVTVALPRLPQIAGETDQPAVAQLQRLEAHGWVRSEPTTITRQEVIKGAMVQRQERAWAFYLSQRGLDDLIDDRWPVAQVRLEQLQGVFCARADCRVVDLHFQWRADRVWDWVLAPEFITVPGLDVAAAGLDSTQRGSARLVQTSSTEGERWELQDVRLTPPSQLTRSE